MNPQAFTAVTINIAELLLRQVTEDPVDPGQRAILLETIDRVASVVHSKVSDPGGLDAAAAMLVVRSLLGTRPRTAHWIVAYFRHLSALGILHERGIVSRINAGRSICGMMMLGIMRYLGYR